jgi:hypothetical protein
MAPPTRDPDDDVPDTLWVPETELLAVKLPWLNPDAAVAVTMISARTQKIVIARPIRLF